MKKSKDSFENNKIKVPFFLPYISDRDVKEIQKALKSPLLTDGPVLREFEKRFALMTGSKYAVGVSNGTSALHLALKSIGIKPNDEVIIPDLTFVATASAVSLLGATPVFADVLEDDMNISSDSILKNITKKTRAIIPVHLAGKPCNMFEIRKIAKKFNLTIIEDCAHAIGSKYRDKHVGNFGSAGCFSFYPTKNITTVEGGMIITNSKKIADSIRILRNHGITKTLEERYHKGKPWEYDVKIPGYNYRLDEIRSALGISQLQNLQRLNNLRKKAVTHYNLNLNKIKGVKISKLSKGNVDSYHLYIVQITNEYGISRDELFRKLLKEGIRTSVHYKPVHKFSAFKKIGKTYDELRNSKLLYERIISLPLYPQITKEELDFVINCIKKYADKTI
ncbi:DegT/DnrJ/EryC1/StrS family aminotransferase [Nitrosarchaeum sp.]|uniref:DegT/DnrJ/EryC1/StrS family aminotransferase n=1 Tax=Nitrosarchaeum sp. TaxID=2026886 RepID=UPI00247EF2F2|nr:DegT/DnrJ/EryC1/StrS family aminotransferase [Nitrosarchaeum sp.]MCV0411888.1 DegT/DnrJ/EryC1/StrS family aminotransferase [Nitrosarchaeum sp.]